MCLFSTDLLCPAPSVYEATNRKMILEADKLLKYID